MTRLPQNIHKTTIQVRANGSNGSTLQRAWPFFLSFLVIIWADSVESGVLSNSQWSKFTDCYIYVFHVPLFFFLAGLFVARSSAHRTFHDYLIDKISVIAYPYFLWSLLEGLIQIFASRYTNNHFNILYLIRIIYNPIDQYWFMYVLFLMYTIYWWINHARISVSNFFVFAILLYAIETFGLNIIAWDVLHSFCVLVFISH